MKFVQSENLLFQRYVISLNQQELTMIKKEGQTFIKILSMVILFLEVIISLHKLMSGALRYIVFNGQS